jgi:hypothetical protein
MRTVQFLKVELIPESSTARPIRTRGQSIFEEPT